MDPTQPQGTPRWQYSISWRYGHLLLTAAGLALLGVGASDVEPATISVTMMTLGFLMAILGVAFPRMRGPFTAGPTGIGADMLPVAEVDPLIAIVSVPATSADVAIEGPVAEVGVEAPAGVVMIGDVRNALIAFGFGPDHSSSGLGQISYGGPGGKHIRLPGAPFWDDEPASPELMAILRSWGIQPVASGKFAQPGEGKPPG